MKRTLLASVLLLPIASATALCVAPATAQAADGDAVLERLDAMAESFEDQKYTAEMHLYRGGKKTKTLVFSAKMKGLEGSSTGTLTWKKKALVVPLALPSLSPLKLSTSLDLVPSDHGHPHVSV